jgi:hypothetical protein
MNARSAIGGLAVAAVIIGAAWLALRRSSPTVVDLTGTGSSSGPRQAWEPAAFKGNDGSTQDYLAWVDRNYYGTDNKPVTLDARDARAWSGGVAVTGGGEDILDARDALARRPRLQ